VAARDGVRLVHQCTDLHALALLLDCRLAVAVCRTRVGGSRLFRATWSMQKLRWMPKLLTKYIPRGRRDELNHDLAVAQAAVICFGLVLFGYVHACPWR